MNTFVSATNGMRQEKKVDKFHEKTGLIPVKKWKKLLDDQEQALPVIKNVIANTREEKSSSNEDVLIRKIDQQLNATTALDAELTRQSVKVADHRSAKQSDTIKGTGNGDYSEEILRERIKNIEKNYESIKADFLKYLSAFV